MVIVFLMDAEIQALSKPKKGTFGLHTLMLEKDLTKIPALY